ncbi:RNA polymerase sigma factor [Chitinophaga sp. XS-30]|uniref:RNA polymerase sigma factor n=1 Tax=Chitinophaga sp. XS-30 TaxID=2604421 RepID=UPI00143DC7E5|nr:sigma-70 family RNA polymerase sigma factor [Chitinophaga sp. XS-30]
MHLSDKLISLWGKVREGDKEALFVLYDDMYFHLVRYGLSQYADSDLVKDCIGQLFLKLWDRHESLNDVENVQSYLFTSLRRLLHDYLNAQNRVSTSIRNIQEEDEASYEEIIIAREKEEEVRRNLSNALKTLSPKQIELIRLKFFENLSYKEIAHISSQSVKTSYNTIYDALKVLRLKLRM